MSQMYRYYQATGGEEAWTPVQANISLETLKPTFITVLTLDTLLDEHPTREVLDAVKYQGPMYFDLDDADDVANSIAGANELIKKLKGSGLKDQDFEIYLSGKKGLHILISPVCFIEKQAPMAKLPAIYKEIAFKFITETVDFQVYTARKGRMLRTCFNVRDNGNYRVPVSVAELEALTPEGYQALCKQPRPGFPPAQPEFRAEFALVFDAARQKVLSIKRKKPKPVDPATLKQHAPTVQQLMRGEGLADDIGFNKIAIQVALYAREVGMKEDQLVEACQGLIKNHHSDGHRYNSARKREQELRRMFFYIDDNPGYEYAIGPIRALLKSNSTRVVNEAGEEVEEDIFSCGVKVGASCYLASRGEAGDAPITNFVFSEVTQLVDPKEGNITGLVCRIKGDSSVQNNAKLGLFPSSFTGSSAIHGAVSSYGGTFTGSDIHARGLYQIMLKTVSKTKYLVETEGISLISVPTSNFPELRKPFVIWADGDGVRVPDYVRETGVEFEFQGYPDQRGVLKTDLTKAPSLSQWVTEDSNKQLLLRFFKAYFACQSPDVTGKMLGWMVACFWRQLLHAVHSKFPLLHVYGVAGAGKTEFTETLLSLFYYNATPQTLTPSSSNFALLNLVGGSGCIPVLLDEYKPSVMDKGKLEAYRAMFRDSYNMKDTQRGGGNRTKDSFNALNKVTLSGPIAFLAEAVETETALVERMVLVSYRRPASTVVAKNYKNFQFVKANKQIFSILGAAIAGRVARSSGVEDLANQFNRVYQWAQDAHMLREEDSDAYERGEMDEAEYNRRASNKQRNVYNNSVAYFGLLKVKGLLMNIFGEEFESLLGEEFKSAESAIFTKMDVITRSTVPEYVKVLLTMSDMTRLPTDSPFQLTEDLDYNLTEYAGKQVIILAPRAAYAKYRAYTRNMGLSPMYHSDASFIEGMYDCPQYVGRGYQTARQRVDTIMLDAQELIRAGVNQWNGKPKEITTKK